jgi:hypothetical protein
MTLTNPQKVQSHLQRAEIYQQDLNNGKKSAATALRKELLQLKKLCDAWRVEALAQQKAIQPKARSSKLPLEKPKLVRQVAMEQEVEPPSPPSGEPAPAAKKKRVRKTTKKE